MSMWKDTCALRPCAESNFRCECPCGQQLSCLKHWCQRGFHLRPCGECLLTGKRSCPCGKVGHKGIPCEVPCHHELHCERNCQRMKECGRQGCKRRCCDGDCPLCLEV